MKKTAFIAIFALILSIILPSCTELWGSLDDPADPKSDNYQGYPTIDDPAKLTLVSDWNGTGDPVFTCAKVNGATTYALQVASDADFSAVVYSNDTLVSNTYDAPDLVDSLGHQTTYWWRMRASPAQDTPWSAAKSFTVSKVVATPALSPATGTYTSSQSVSITTTTTGASIRYTTDGTKPTSTSGTPYSEGITVSETQTIKAIAYKTGWVDSEVTSAIFTLPNAIVMIPVPAGTFQRDSTATNTSTVSAFRMSEKEITRTQFSSIMGTDPSDPSNSSGTNDPVQIVNWYHAIAFCNKLSIREGLEPVYSVAGVDFNTLTFTNIPTSNSTIWDETIADWNASGYRLPAEMEWMWAAMGATSPTTGYAKAFAGSNGGSNAIGDYAWYYANSSGKTHPTGTKLPNELGLYDMSGNVLEWSWDGYGNYPNGPLTDYRGAASDYFRYLRGGSYNNNSSNCAIGYREFKFAATTSYPLFDVGFRVAMNATPLAINFYSLSANGTTGTINTTALTLTFNEDPSILVIDDITLTGATKGTLSGTGTSRTLTVSNITVTNGSEITVSLANPAGFTFTPASRTVVVNVDATTSALPLFTMVSIPAGSFNNGISEVTLSAFRMSKYEITQSQYQTVMRTNPSYFASNTDAANCPVEQVTWYDAVEFCNRLSALDGLSSVYSITFRNPATGYPITSASVTQDLTKNGYRLPTEAQWEYAARGGSTSTYYWGNATDDATVGQYAWYGLNSGDKTHTVGQKTANAYGLYDIAGNVWEWVWDWYGNYSSVAQTNPIGASSGSTRVLRGGCWGNPYANLSPAFRYSTTPSYRDYFGSFRIIAP